MHLKIKIIKFLKKNFPKQNIFIDRNKDEISNNQRFDINNENNEKLKTLDDSKLNFVNYHSSINFWNEITTLFGKEIIKINKKHFRSIDDLKNLSIRKDRKASRKKDIYLHSSVSINTAVNKANSVRSIHLDNLNKMYAGLYYLREEEDNSEGGDLVLYRWNKNLTEEDKIKIIQEDDFHNNCEAFSEIV